jgi:hypothetical protein
MRRRISLKLVMLGLAISAVATLSPVVVTAVSYAAGASSAPRDPSSASAFVPTGVSQGTEPITRIELRLFTANRNGAGTDGNVFVGVAGREFFVDSAATGLNDFERGSDYTYRFGDRANVMRPDQNDPRSPWQLRAVEWQNAPTYIRFEPGSDWDIERADITITFSGRMPIFDSLLSGNAHLWLGTKRGKFLWFHHL